MANPTDNPISSPSPTLGDDAPDLTDSTQGPTNDSMSHPITAPLTNDDKMASEACQAEVSERQAGLDLIAQGIQKLVNVENECLKLASSVEGDTGSTSSAPAQDLASPSSIDALKAPGNRNVQGHESTTKALQELLATVQGELKAATPAWAPSPVQSCDFAQALFDELDAAFPFVHMNFMCRGRDGMVWALPPWSVPLPFALDASAYVLRDVRLVRLHLAGARPTPLADNPRILHAFVRAHSLLCEWVREMVRVKTAVPFCGFLDNRSRRALMGEDLPELVGGPYTLCGDGDALARIQATELQEAGDQDKQWAMVRSHMEILKTKAPSGYEDDDKKEWGPLERDATQRLEVLAPDLDDYWFKEAATLFELVLNRRLLPRRLFGASHHSDLTFSDWARQVVRSRTPIGNREGEEDFGR
ncbi:hypothetical protein C8A01DRAFT_34016 [Parachaetomium inaequale]|uniref:Uncharacterized protein n=1 Tax=Parachaetomium inaequale TaxID=2588326 RepID=A0AAN6PKX9_9PEZI|nr:hypothetical protein C8A01DRAFT_34016 [Parachaetomium inaequale]